MNSEKQDAREAPDDLAARPAIAEEAVRKQRKRIWAREWIVAAFTKIPPRLIGNRLNKLAVEDIVGFIKSWFEQMPRESALEVSNWSKHYLESLNEHAISSDVERLENLGVKRESMAISMMLIRFSPMLDASFAQLGTKRKRRKRAKALLTPVPVLRDLAETFGEVPALFWHEIPNPSKIASDLKMLSSMLSWGEYLYGILGANSLLEVSKFALASLVYETTGKFLDREVSTLTYAALDDPDYDETRHRVWRINNYERLQRNIPIVTRVLVSLNTVASAQKQTQ